MDSAFGGKGIECPCCNTELIITIKHTMKDKHLDEIQESLEVREK